MNIIIHRNGENYGPYTLDQVKDLIRNRTFHELDLSWYEGRTDWISLKDVLSPVPPPTPQTKKLPDTSPQTVRISNPLVLWFGITLALVVPPLGFLLGLMILTNPADRKYSRPIFIVSAIVGTLWMIRFYLPDYMHATTSDQTVTNTTSILPQTVPQANNTPEQPVAQLTGDALSSDITVQADNGADADDSEIMHYIWSLAKAFPAANKINLTVHLVGKDWYGKDIQVAIPITLDNLTNARKYADPTFYDRNDLTDATVVADKFGEGCMKFKGLQVRDQ